MTFIDTCPSDSQETVSDKLQYITFTCHPEPILAYASFPVWYQLAGDVECEGQQKGHSKTAIVILIQFFGTSL